MKETEKKVYKLGKENQKMEETVFTAKDIKDFLEKTNTNVKITFVKDVESPFITDKKFQGRNFVNKYKVTISNKNGTTWFYFFDSIKNYIDMIEPDTEDVVSCFGMDVSYGKDYTLDEFSREFFDPSEEIPKIKKAFAGCRRACQGAERLFTEQQIEELIRLSNEF